MAGQNLDCCTLDVFQSDSSVIIFMFSGGGGGGKSSHFSWRGSGHAWPGFSPGPLSFPASMQ